MASVYDAGIYAAWLHRQPGVSPMRLSRLIKTFGSAKALYEQASAGALPVSDEFPPALFRTLCRNATESALDETACSLQESGIRVLLSTDENYPRLLSMLPSAPKVLYLRGKGKLSDLKYSVAFVGSRRCSNYGARVARRYAKALSERGVTIVSGMAFGIDAASHTGALEGGAPLPTIAVLASGVDVPSPASNTPLYRSILERGLAVSEAAPGTQPVAGMYPVRNRIIAGLSQAVFVPEASMGSGSWHTVNYADDYNREILACPGRVEDPLCAGSNEMLRLGATIVLSPDDLLSVFSFTELPLQPEEKPAPVLSEEAHLVVDLLKKSDLSADELFELVDLPMNRLLSLLTNLSSQGIIERTEYMKFHLL